MKPLNSLLLASLLMVFPCAAQQIPIASSISYEGTNPSNNIVLTWESIPTKLYNVLTTTALGQQPWVPLNPSPIYSSNNLVRFRDTNSQPASFYKVVKLDTDPPEIWRLNPGSNATAVARQSPLKAWLRDETAIDHASLVLTVGTNPPATLADPRLAYTNGTLTYTPATNQFLGTHGETVTAKLAFSDTLGHRATNTWPFKLELTPILASNVVLITATSPLTLASTNGDTYVFNYTGASSGLTNGHILVSTDASFPYKRLILSVTDNPGAHTVSLVTTQASLAECIQQGSIRFSGDASQQADGAGGALRGIHAAAAQPGRRIPLDGTVIYDNGTFRVEVVSGQVTFNPEVTYAADFNWGLSTFDLDISGTVDCDLILRGSLTGSGSFNPEPIALLANPVPVPVAGGFIGPIPVVLTAQLEVNLGLEAQAEAEGSLTAEFAFTRTLSFGAKLRNGEWDRYANQTGSSAWSSPAWQINGSGFLQVYLEPKITLLVDYVLGGSANLKPYVELDATTCVQPGQAGIDLRGYVGLSSTLALDFGILNRFFPNLPSRQPFEPLKEPIPNAHAVITIPVGSPPQTFGNMVWIPCGTFTMGSPPSEPARVSDEGPQTQATISQGFWMGKYEVTQGGYLAVMGSNPSRFTAANGYGTDLSRPVEQVNWFDVVAYCAALTTREQQAGRLPAGYAYRLPTEAEWEYACRAGTTTAFHYGSALRSGMANFYGYYEYLVGDPYHYNPSGAYLGRTTTVGSYAPNAWGLYDMHGNVWEWCSDWWSSSLPGGSVTDPQGAATGSYRVIRGGGSDHAFYCRSAGRGGYIPGGRDPDDRNSNIGFRVVLAPDQP